MKPTPEDIALSDEICDQAVEHGYYHDVARELIAAHCAPLRELAEIGRLAVEHERGCLDPDNSHHRHLGTFSALCRATREYLAKIQTMSTADTLPPSPDGNYCHTRPASEYAITFANAGREVWRGKPDELEALIRDGLRFRKLVNAMGEEHRTPGMVQAWCEYSVDSPVWDGRPITTQLGAFADALPEEAKP